MFSLRTLFIVVGIAALGIAAMASDVYWLGSGFVLVTLGILCWAFLERRTPFWRAFFVFGIVYLVCACVSTFETVSDSLPCTLILRVMNYPVDPFRDDLPLYQPSKDELIDRILAGENRVRRRTVAHGIGALLFGLVGGLLYAWRVKKAIG